MSVTKSVGYGFGGLIGVILGLIVLFIGLPVLMCGGCFTIGAVVSTTATNDS